MKLNLLYFVVLLHLKRSDGQVPEKIIEVGEFRLERFSVKMNYTSAQSFCNERGSWLVEIKTESMRLAFENLIDHKYYWIGGRYFLNAWRWEDGSEVVYNNWNDGKPSRNITVLRIQVRDGKKWFDNPVTDSKPFVCQKVKLREISSSGEQTKLYVSKIQFSCTFVAYSGPSIMWSFSRGGKKFNISAEKGLIFAISNHTSTNDISVQATSNLTINLANCLGPVEVKCIASNSFETAEIGFQLNKMVRTTSAGHFVFSRRDQKLNQVDSETYCKSMNGNLAKITNQKTQNILANASDLLHPDVSTRVGGKASVENDSILWKWPDGSIFYNQTKHSTWIGHPGITPEGKYVSWSKTKPGKSGKYCLNLLSRKNRKWVDSDCDDPYSFICEKSLHGTPVIQSLIADNCSTTITLTWKPAKEAIGVSHRIVLSKNFSNSVAILLPQTFESIPEEDSVVHTFTNLTLSTTYIVKVYVCPEYCLDSCHSSATVRTYDLPGQVRDATVFAQDGGFCNVSWRSPVSEQKIIGYKVSVTSKLLYYSTEVMKNRTYVEENKAAPNQPYYLHTTRPNRAYKFEIKAETCLGTGKSIVSERTCITKRAAPFKIPAPSVSVDATGDGKAEITFFPISEENGPISCVFLIVVRDGNAENVTEYDGQRLRNISASQSTEEKEYIALALPQSELTNRTNGDGLIILNIGTNSATSCDVKNSAAINRTKRSIGNSNIFAKNLPLDRSKSYGLLLVSSTPGNSGDVFYRTSEMVTTSAVVCLCGPGISPAIVGSISIATALLITVLFIRKRRQRAVVFQPPNDDYEQVQVGRAETAPTPNNSGAVYTNISCETIGLRSLTDIPIEKLKNLYNSMRLENDSGFKKEFELIERDSNGQFNVDATSSTKQESSYENAALNNETRVMLQGKGDASYINASYIKGYCGQKKYIAAQGPLPGMENKFWRMVVEQNCRTIVMLTKCVEGSKKICEQYWPEEGQSATYGNINVENTLVKTIGSHTTSTFRVIKDEKSVVVHQFQFLKWPDDGVPAVTSNLFRFHTAVMKAQQSVGVQTPVIIHCSLGSGRTGVFIAYDFLSEERKNLNHIDIKNCVTEMRNQRIGMVQNCHQYILIHKLLLEDYLFGHTEITASDINQIVKEPNARFSKEFENLSLIQPIDDGLMVGISNKTRIAPYQRSLVSIKQNDEADAPFINASYLETYDGRFSLIASEGPTEDSIETFWRAVLDNNISIIIMLTKFTEENQVHCAQYWFDVKDKSLPLGSVTVEMKEKKLENYITREFMITKGNKTKKVLHYQCTDWSDSSCPSSPSVLLDIISKVMEKVHQKERPTVLVHCNNGVGRTGAFCAIMNLLYRFHIESVVDVFREVKDLRDCRRGMVQNLAQYRFCYEAVAAYLNATNVYSTIKTVSEESPYEKYNNA